MNVDVPLINHETTKPYQNADGSPVTIRQHLMNALDAAPPSAQGDAGREEKMKRALLHERLRTVEGEMEFSSENVTMLKNCSAEIAKPSVYLQVVRVLDPAAAKE